MSFIRCTNSNEATSNGFTYCRCTFWFAFRSWDRNYWHNCSYLFALRSKRKTPWSALMAPLFPSDPFGFCSSFRIEISALLEAQATKWFDSFCAWSICANHSVLDQFQPHDPHLSVCVCVQQVSYFSFSSQILLLFCCLHLFFGKWLKCGEHAVFLCVPGVHKMRLRVQKVDVFIFVALD